MIMKERGASIVKFLLYIHRDISSNESDTLLQLLQKREHELVRFNDFTSGVTCCFLLKGKLLYSIQCSTEIFSYPVIRNLLSTRSAESTSN